MKVSPVSADLLIKLGLGIAVLGLGYWAVKKVTGIGGAVLDSVTETATGLVTGNNTFTENARTDAYRGEGILGTLGAATDNATGGVFSRFGEWLGGKAYDLTHSDQPTPPTTIGHRDAYWRS
jgi:hypothetical protein